MRHSITNNDLSLVTENTLTLSLRLEVLREDKTILGVITGNIMNGSFSIDSNSDVRRTCNIEILPDAESKVTLDEGGLFWLNRLIKLYIGIKDIKETEVWYSQGCYYIENASLTYNSTSNILKLSCNDYMTKLNGEKNGNIGALKTTIPAYIEDKETGEVIKYNIIRDVAIQILTQLAHIHDYMIDDIGVYKAMPDYNKDWAKYRKENPLWNVLPNDLEFDAGCSISSILTKIRDIFPNYEMFFDEEGTFILQMAPSCYEDDVIIPNEFLQNILVSEDFSVDMNSIRNMCMVWGKTIDADYFAESSTYNENTYAVTIDKYEKYSIGDNISFKILNSNEEKCFMQINGLKPISIYDEVTGTEIDKNKLESDKRYVFKIKYISHGNNDKMVAYLLGQWQAHALNVLVDGTESNVYHTLPDGNKVIKYSEDYFKNIYNCDTVSLTIIQNSPFTVQKLGEILDVKNGDQYSNIESDSLALARAEHENWKNCRLLDSVTINTKITPFIDVNIKCTYQRSDIPYPQQYIVKSVSHNFSDGITTWNLYKFYPLYQDTLDAIGTHKTLSNYKHGTLGKYTFEQLSKFVSGGNY